MDRQVVSNTDYVEIGYISKNNIALQKLMHNISIRALTYTL